jgi:hypothetical protein
MRLLTCDCRFCTLGSYKVRILHEAGASAQNEWMGLRPDDVVGDRPGKGAHGEAEANQSLNANGIHAETSQVVPLV